MYLYMDCFYRREMAIPTSLKPDTMSGLLGGLVFRKVVKSAMRSMGPETHVADVVWIAFMFIRKHISNQLLRSSIVNMQ